MVLLALLILMSGLFLTQVLHPYILDESLPRDVREWLYHYYGSTARASLTMFEATLSGCWPNYSRKMVEDVNPWFIVFWAFYIGGIVFAVTRVITATFIRETLDVAGQQADILVYERMRNRDTYLKKLQLFFSEADVSGDGFVDQWEFDAIMTNPRVRSWLSELELEVHETYALFNLIDDGDGRITYDEFIDGVVRLKGQARCVDVVAIHRDLERVSHLLTLVSDHLGIFDPRPASQSTPVTSVSLTLKPITTGTEISPKPVE